MASSTLDNLSAAGTITGAETLYVVQSSNSRKVTVDNLLAYLFASGAAFGYDAGSGGTVAQDTDRTTGVTINEPSGQITLVSAAGTASWQTFTVTNSTVAATDTIIVNQASGTDLYLIHVTAVGAGSFNITYATTGGTTTEQPVFNFAVIEGASS